MPAPSGVSFQLAKSNARQEPGYYQSPETVELQEQERRFVRVAERYRDSLAKDDPAALALLERLCLFRLGVDVATLASIFTGESAQASAAASEELAAMTPAQLQAKLNWLEGMKLVESSQARRDDRQNESPTDRSYARQSVGVTREDQASQDGITRIKPTLWRA